MTLVKITGNTYPVREALKALGGQWDPEAKAWMLPEVNATEARNLVNTGNTSNTASTRRVIARRETKRCWECGRSFTYAEARANDGDWQGGYCGC